MNFTTDQTMASHLGRRYLQWALVHKQYATILSMDVNGISDANLGLSEDGRQSFFSMVNHIVS